MNPANGRWILPGMTLAPKYTYAYDLRNYSPMFNFDLTNF